MAINAISPIPLLPQVMPNTAVGAGQNQGSQSASATQSADSGFNQFLDNAMNRLDGLQKTADSSSQQLATGQIQNIDSVMIALEKANLGFSLAVEVRNKVLDAYNQVMRMQM
ncbi:MAG TPA: flagellar hook-basal body complex protein FliE [Desulfobacteria bacterium]|nr:flagellar hook-basal body complex protein FliE [Desulfobacteria bacterium]